MTTLRINEPGELQLTLHGEADNQILTSLRHWPHWTRADVERDPHNPKICLAVTLVTDQVHEATVRDILKRGFGVTFPTGGGEANVLRAVVPTPKRR